MKFSVGMRDKDKPDIIPVYDLKSGKIIAMFKDNSLAHDYVDFLNDKYHDKEINKEWPRINRGERIKYHLEQLQLLTGDKMLVWNEHGTGVKEGYD
jgi:hypothetical protein